MTWTQRPGRRYNRCDALYQLTTSHTEKGGTSSFFLKVREMDGTLVRGRMQGGANPMEARTRDRRPGFRTGANVPKRNLRGKDWSALTQETLPERHESENSISILPTEVQNNNNWDRRVAYADGDDPPLRSSHDHLARHLHPHGTSPYTRLPLSVVSYVIYATLQNV